MFLPRLVGKIEIFYDTFYLLPVVNQVFVHKMNGLPNRDKANYRVAKYIFIPEGRGKAFQNTL